MEDIDKSKKPIDLDDVLTNELGQFGGFQLRSILLVAVPIIMSTFMSEFIFSAAAIPHRCRIPECEEDSKLQEFEPEWITNAIPESSSGLSSCQRFVPTGNANGSLGYCPANLFDLSREQNCDGYVYARDNTVVYDFNLGCQEWLRALAGTLNSVGSLLVLPITGYISDRFGRRIALVINVFNMALIGLIRAFSVNYTMYMVLQILQTTLGAGIFSTAYIFATELVGPKYRVVTSAFVTSMFSLGQVVLGTVAWLVQPWRYMLMVLHIPCFIVVTYYWILPESVRWLLSKQKYPEAKEVLKNVAKVNKTKISDKSLEGLMNPPETHSHEHSTSRLIKSVINSRVLLRRVFTTPVWWITSTFVYQGLAINSTNISDTMYLNFILISIVDIPGFFTAVLALNKIGRKPTLSFGYFFSATCNLSFIFISPEFTTLRLAIFLLGKFGTAICMTSVYLFTSELYPTEYRHSLIAWSSMIGRIGSISAPLTPVLMQYWRGLPSLLFGCLGIFSGLLVLTQPETLGTKMPDTLAEAEALGKTKSNLSENS